MVAASVAGSVASVMANGGSRRRLSAGRAENVTGAFTAMDQRGEFHAGLSYVNKLLRENRELLPACRGMLVQAVEAKKGEFPKQTRMVDGIGKKDPT